MASEAYDYEPFLKTDHNMKEIADAIRHKGYGKDVREAIAQGMEAYDRLSGEVFDRIKKLDEKIEKEIQDRKGTIQTEEQKRQEEDKKLNDLIKKLISRIEEDEKLLHKLNEQLNSGMPLDRWIEEAKEEDNETTDR